ncbi:hypothetical protein ACFQ34_14710, partial [Pseudonocardia benzenivorans]
ARDAAARDGPPSTRPPSTGAALDVDVRRVVLPAGVGVDRLPNRNAPSLVLDRREPLTSDMR